MTDKVVDASAIAAIVFNEPGRVQAETLLSGASLCAPAFIDVEVASVCLKKLRLKLYPEAVVLAMYAAYKGINIRKEPILLDDASYLWLARHLGITLVTLDDRLQKAAAKI